MLLSVVSLLVTDYHKTCGRCLPGDSVGAGSHQPQLITTIVHCFLQRFYSPAHTPHPPELPIPIISLSDIPIIVLSVQAQCPTLLMIGYCWPWILSWTSNIALLKCSLWRYTIRVSFSSLWFRLFYFAASLTSVIARCLPLSAAVMLPGHGTQCSASAISTQPTRHFLPHAQSK